MAKQAGKFPTYDRATVIIMAVGVILYFATPLLIRWFGFDSDVLGLLILFIGLVMLVVGIIVRLVIRKVGSRGQIN